MNKHVNWLHSEMSLWVKDGLIDETTATSIARRYPLSGGKSWSHFLLTAIGAIIFGLGIILFFAYNWNAFPKVAKLACIFTVLVGFHMMAWFIHRRNSEQTNLIEGFHLIGTMMFGAGIWLIAQIYHINEHYPTAFLIWGLGALIFSWALPSVIQGIVALALISAWGASEIFDFNDFHVLSCAIVLFGIVPLAWWQKSRLLLLLSLASAIMLAMANIATQLEHALLFYLLFSLSTLFIALAYLSVKTSFPGSADVLRGMGVVVYGLSLFLMTFADANFRFIIHEGAALTQSVLWGALLLSVLVWAVLFVYGLKARLPLTKSAQHMLILISAVTVAVQLLNLPGISEATLSLVYNIVLAAHCVLLIMRGTDNLHWQQVVVGCVTLAALVYMRFIDLFHSLLMRSLVFVLLGAALFYIGHIYAQEKARGQNHA